MRQNDVDEEVFDRDGDEKNEAREASAGDRRAIADADQAGQLVISGEAQIARTLRTLELPTDAARMAHNETHVPFRDWYLSCESWTKFSAQTSCGEQDSRYTAENPDRLHVHSNSGREQNSAMYHIRGKAQWSGDQLHVLPHKLYEPKNDDLKETYVESYTVPDPHHSSPSKGSSRTWSRTTPHWRVFTTHTECMSITSSEKACLSVSRRRPCPSERGDLLESERGDLLDQLVRS